MASAFIQTHSEDISILVETLQPWHGHGERDKRERLRVTVPASLGARLFVSLLAAFRQQHPQTTVELHSSERTRERCDEWKTRSRYFRSSRVTEMVCASRDYWRENAMPATPFALAMHECITTRDHEGWRFRDAGGNVQDVFVGGPLQSTNREFALQAALQDLGVVRLPLFMIADALWSGQLVPALREFQLLSKSTLDVVHASADDISPCARILVDQLVAQLAEDTDCEQAMPMEGSEMRAASCG